MNKEFQEFMDDKQPDATPKERGALSEAWAIAWAKGVESERRAYEAQRRQWGKYDP